MESKSRSELIVDILSISMIWAGIMGFLYLAATNNSYKVVNKEEQTPADLIKYCRDKTKDKYECANLLLLTDIADSLREIAKK